jgi:hypothetical protein
MNFPNNVGSTGTVLTTDASGNLSWLTGGSTFTVGGDLQGTGSNATYQTVSRLSGDGTGAVQIPSSTSFIFATTNIATAAATGYFRFPRSGQLQTPIMGAIGQSGAYVFMSYGQNAYSALDEVKIGNSEVGFTANHLGVDVVSLNAQYKLSLNVNGVSQISEPVRRAVEIGRDPITNGPYLGIYGPSGTTGMMAMRVQSGAGISFTLNFPNNVGATGTVLSTDASGNLSWIVPAPTGTIGPTGSVGPPGAQGTFGINVWDEGVSIGTFGTINFQGGLVVATGPLGVINVNNMGDFAQVGVTGLGASGALQLASGAMVQWNVENTKMSKGALGHTTIGTAAGWVTIRNSAFYNINSNINFTGLPSGVVVNVQQYLGATGAFGSGTPIAQSVSYLQNFAGASAGMIINSVNKNYSVYIPSGTSITTWVQYLQVSIAGKAGGGSPVFLSPTGTYFEIREIGD